MLPVRTKTRNPKFSSPLLGMVRYVYLCFHQLFVRAEFSMGVIQTVDTGGQTEVSSLNLSDESLEGGDARENLQDDGGLHGDLTPS